MQTTMKKAVALAIVSMAYASTTLAAKPGTPTLGEVLEASGVSVTGYLDTSYTYLTGTGTFTGGTANRVFDRERNSFNLHTFNITGSSLPNKGFGVLLDVNAGSDANIVSPSGAGAADEFDVTQAFVNYADGSLTVIGGKFNTLAGFEVIKSTDNLNFSRGILFGYAIPFTHTGVRASFAASDKMKFHLGVNNGWDVLKESSVTDRRKTVELGANINVIKDLSLNAAVYQGREPSSAGTEGQRTLIDVVASYALTKQLTLALNVDMAEQEDALGTGTDAEWRGIAAYAGFQLNDLWKFAVRLETFDDKDGFRTGVASGTGGQKWNEATLTAAYLPAKNVELRAEVRADRSDQQAFMQTDGTTKKSQSGVGLEALFKF